MRLLDTLTKAPEHHQATNPGLLRGKKKQLYISTEVHARRGQPEVDEHGAHLHIADPHLGGGGGGEKLGRRHKRET